MRRRRCSGFQVPLGLSICQVDGIVILLLIHDSFSVSVCEHRHSKNEGGWRLVIYLLKLNEFLTPSDVSSGHASDAKVGRRPGHVCHIPRSNRRIPLRSDARRLSGIPLFSSKRKMLYVPGTPLRSHDGHMCLHSGSETGKDLIDETSSHPVLISRRLLKSVQIVKSREGMDGAFSETMRGAKFSSEPNKIRATTDTDDCFSGLVQGRAFTTEARQQAVVPVLLPALVHHGLRFPAAESLLGLMSATSPTIPLGRMHMRPFQLDIFRQVRIERDRVAWVPVIGQSAQELR